MSESTSDFLARISQMSQKRLTLLALELYEQLEAEKRAQHEPIAIIGAACRFPGDIKTLDDYWATLEAGRSVVSDTPNPRWGPPPDDLPALAHGGYLENVDRFDANFFGISAGEARAMDPQQRHLLELSWEAIESAGYSPAKLVGSETGVFVGLTTQDYAGLIASDAKARGLDPYLVATGTVANMAAGRISYCLGLRGASVTLDAACASSLVAVHFACRSLRSKESSLALAGGVSLLLSEEVSASLARAGVLSPEGRCRTFDANADGYVRSDGCGVVLLKRLSDALRDRDDVLGVIRGTAVNQDGPRARLTTPAGPAQEVLLRTALADAGARPEEIGYVEVHGLGTRFGDAIEARALSSVLSANRTEPLYVGSSKTNLGYLEAASGMASLLKTVLALKNEALPAHLHVERPSPHILWDKWRLRAPSQLTPWKRSEKRRLAGVSAFGFNGTDAHVILEEPPRQEAASTPDRACHVLCLSAKTEASLIELITRYRVHLENHPGQPLGDLCFTANEGRAEHSSRVALVIDSVATLTEGLAVLAAGGTPHNGARGTVTRAVPGIVLSFGQGTTAPLAPNWQSVAPFREAMDRCREAFARVGGLGAGELAERFAREYAEATTLLTWGAGFRAASGTGWAAAVAACVAGVISLDDAARLAMALASRDEAAIVDLLARTTFTDGQLDVYGPDGKPLGREALSKVASWLGNGAEQMADSTRHIVGAATGDPVDIWRSLFGTVARLFVVGLSVDWQVLEAGFHRRRVALPTYPFRGQRYWFNDASEAKHSVPPPPPSERGGEPIPPPPPSERRGQLPPDLANNSRMKKRPVTLRRSAHFFDANVVHDSASESEGSPPGCRRATFLELVAALKDLTDAPGFERLLAALPPETRDGVLKPIPPDAWLSLDCVTDLLAVAQRELFDGDANKLSALGQRFGARRYKGPSGSKLNLVSPDMLLGFGITSWPEWYRNNGRVWIARRDSTVVVIAFEGVATGSPAYWAMIKGWLSALLEFGGVASRDVALRGAPEGPNCEVRCAWG